MSQTYFGAPIEIPSEEETKKLIEVLPSASDPVWKKEEEKDWTIYPIFDQGSTNQCTWFTIKKLLGINYLKDEGAFLDFSASYGYEQRENRPSSGDSVNSIRNTGKRGVTLEQLYPSKTKKNNDTAELTAKPHAAKVAEVFKIDELLDLPTGDIDAIASTMKATGKGVMLWFWATSKEWKQFIPQLIDKNITLYTAPVRHSVTAVDFFIYDGKKCLLIEDSWGTDTGHGGRRLITEDFLKARNYYAGYVTKFQFSTAPVVVKPKIPVNFGEENASVGVLQRYLQAKGFFPANHGTTNYYGSITAEAVLKWQLANNVDNPETLKSLKGHYFGQKSLAKV